MNPARQDTRRRQQRSRRRKPGRCAPRVTEGCGRTTARRTSHARGCRLKRRLAPASVRQGSRPLRSSSRHPAPRKPHLSRTPASPRVASVAEFGRRAPALDERSRLGGRSPHACSVLSMRASGGRGTSRSTSSRAGVSCEWAEAPAFEGAASVSAARVSAAARIRPTQQRAGAPSGAPGLLLCQEAGVSPALLVVVLGASGARLCGDACFVTGAVTRRGAALIRCVCSRPSAVWASPADARAAGV